MAAGMIMNDLEMTKGSNHGSAIKAKIGKERGRPSSPKLKRGQVGRSPTELLKIDPIHNA